MSYQRGESDRTNTDAGYTNITNIGNALDSIDGVTCANGDPSCVPINLFGGFGSITEDMVGYSSATALEQQSYVQSISAASISGSVNAIKLPTAEEPWPSCLAWNIAKSRQKPFRMSARNWHRPAAWAVRVAIRCPIEGGFNVGEAFVEAIMPLVSDKTGFQSLDLELGYRYSDYNMTGTDDTWKYGVSWRPVNSVLIRAMQQRAARAPNVGELAAPNTTGLDNATSDPCSESNTAISADLRATCIATGMTNAQVGTVEDITAGQINGFFGTDLNDLPAPESADTLTVGVVFTPEWGSLKSPMITLDYYDIEINQYINQFGAQEVLDSCYVTGDADACAKIVRIGGTLTLPGSGVQLYTTNLDYLKAEGFELNVSFGFDIGAAGSINLSAYINKYLTQESRSSITSDVIDCNGMYGNQCGNPLPSVSWTQTTGWEKGPFSAELYWRHLGSTSIEPVQRSATFEQFQSIDSFDYFDLTASWAPTDYMSVRVGVYNILNEDPPVLGNEAADTRSNSGNTFPSVYTALGQTYSLGVHFRF